MRKRSEEDRTGSEQHRERTVAIVGSERRDEGHRGSARPRILASEGVWQRASSL